MSKAAVGNGKALKGMGIDIDGAKTAAELLDAVQKNVTGSAEAWALTADGKTSVAAVRQGEAMEKMGAVVDKISQAILPIATAALEGVASAIEFVSKRMDIFAPIAAGLGIVIGAVLVPALVASAIAGWAALAPILVAAAPFIAVAAAIAGVIFVLDKMGILKVVGDMISNVSKVVLPAFGTAFNAVATVVSGVFGTIGTVIKGNHQTPSLGSSTA